MLNGKKWKQSPARDLPTELLETEGDFFQLEKEAFPSHFFTGWIASAVRCKKGKKKDKIWRICKASGPVFDPSVY